MAARNSGATPPLRLLSLIGPALLVCLVVTLGVPCDGLPAGNEVVPQTCLYDKLGYNPWDEWSVLVHDYLQFDGGITYGRVAVTYVLMTFGGTIDNRHPTPYSQNQWALSAQGGLVSDFNVYGNVEGAAYMMSNTVIHGDLNSTGKSTFADSSVTGKMRSAEQYGLTSGNAPADFQIDATIQMSVDTNPVTDWENNGYFLELSNFYKSLPQSVGGLDTTSTPGEIHVTLHSRVNVVNEITIAQLNAANKLVLKGIPNAVVIFNIAGGDTEETYPKFNKFDVVYEGSKGKRAPPTFNRVLFNFPDAYAVLLGPKAGIVKQAAHLRTSNHAVNRTAVLEAHARAALASSTRWVSTQNTEEKPVYHFSVLNPYNQVAVGGAILKGQIFAATGGILEGGEVHQVMPWGRIPVNKKRVGDGPTRPRPPTQPIGKCLWGHI